MSPAGRGRGGGRRREGGESRAPQPQRGDAVLGTHLSRGAGGPGALPAALSLGMGVERGEGGAAPVLPQPP